MGLSTAVDRKSLKDRRILFSATAALILYGLLLFQLAFPPILGLADNGDYWRIQSTVGIYYPSYQSQSLGELPPKDYFIFEYVQRFYRLDQPISQPWVTSQILTVQSGQENQHVVC